VKKDEAYHAFTRGVAYGVIALLVLIVAIQQWG